MTQMANYTLSIEADSGYCSDEEGRCTPEQYEKAVAALSGKKREWIGLTIAEQKNLATYCDECVTNEMYFDIYKRIEKRLKEKNHDH